MSAEMTFPPDYLIGPYKVVRELGRGGIGVVYEVEHVRLGVRYALKAFMLEGKNADFLKKRFLAEGRILARLSHPRIVRVYDMDVADGFAWFTMDYVESPDGRPRTLADMPQAGMVPESDVAGWYEDVREALTVVHAAGVVHRDVKLENVLVGNDGHAVLADFGISRILDDDLRRQVAVTRTLVSKDEDMKVVLGTAAYQAPELRAGGDATAASDAYALGVAFFRLLTGMWYEPGPRAFDLLAPFGRRWRTLFAALLAERPAERSMPRFALPAHPSRRSRVWGIAALSFLLGALAVFAATRDWTHKDAAPTWTEAEDLFDIPDSVK